MFLLLLLLLLLRRLDHLVTSVFLTGSRWAAIVLLLWHQLPGRYFHSHAMASDKSETVPSCQNTAHRRSGLHQRVVVTRRFDARHRTIPPSVTQTGHTRLHASLSLSLSRCHILLTCYCKPGYKPQDTGVYTLTDIHILYAILSHYHFVWNKFNRSRPGPGSATWLDTHQITFPYR